MTLATDTLAAPDTSHGNLIGIDDPGAVTNPRRLCIEAYLPSDRFDVTSSREWVDITGPATGIEISRGASRFAGPTETGVAVIEFETDRHELSPWLHGPASFQGAGELFAPGLPIRVAVTGDATRTLDHVPIFTGEVESWVETWKGETPMVEVIVVDPWARLARSQVVGLDVTGFTQTASPDFSAAVEDLLDEAGHEFGSTIWVGEDGTEDGDYGLLQVGYEIDPDGGGYNEIYTADGTVADIIRTMCDTWGLWPRATADGRIRIGKSYPPIDISIGGTDYEQSSGSWTEPYPSAITIDTDNTPAGDALALTLGTDLDGIVNHCVVTGPRPVNFEGGLGAASGESEDTASIATYGRRTLEIATYATSGNTDISDAVVANRADLTVQMSGLELDVDHNGADVWTLELGQPITVEYSPPAAPSAVELGGYVRSLTHRITPRTDSAIDWTVAVGVDAYTFTVATEPTYIVDDTTDDPLVYIVCDGDPILY